MNKPNPNTIKIVSYIALFLYPVSIWLIIWSIDNNINTIAEYAGIAGFMLLFITGGIIQVEFVDRIKSFRQKRKAWKAKGNKRLFDSLIGWVVVLIHIVAVATGWGIYYIVTRQIL